MFVLKVVGVMDGLYILVHQGHTILLMAPNPRRPARHVHWATIVKTVARLTTHQMSVQLVIIVLWELNIRNNFLAHQGHTILMSTRHQDHWPVYHVLLVVIVSQALLNLPCVLWATIVQMVQAQERNLHAMPEHTMMNLDWQITHSARTVHRAHTVRMDPWQNQQSHQYHAHLGHTIPTGKWGSYWTVYPAQQVCSVHSQAKLMPQRYATKVIIAQMVQ